jgi:hypothetical protein
MADRPVPLGLLGEFGSPEALVAAARGAKAAGVQGLDAYTPFPVDDLNEVLALRDQRIAWLGIGGAVFGAMSAYAMQIATNLDYPLDIGGRPLLSLQAFALIGFELTVLFAVLFMVAGFFALNRLPRYYHPLFWVDRFERATRDGFFLFVPAADEQALAAAQGLLARLGAMSIDEVPR